MKDYQLEAFRLASRLIDKNSKFYNEDIKSLREHYSKMNKAKCIEAIARFESRPSERELRMNNLALDESF